MFLGTSLYRLLIMSQIKKERKNLKMSLKKVCWPQETGNGGRRYLDLQGEGGHSSERFALPTLV